jgi:hypothetical protein
MFLLAAKTLANENLSGAHTSGWLFETTLHLSVVVVVGTELILLPLPPARLMQIMKSKCAPLAATAMRERKVQMAPREKSPRHEKSFVDAWKFRCIASHVENKTEFNLTHF